MSGWSPEKLLPHSGAMVLLEEVVEVAETRAQAAVRIGEDSLFYRPNVGVPAWVGIEYMAQAVGLTAGYRAHMAGKAVSIGFLLGTRSFTATVPAFRLGARLIVNVDEIWEDGQMAVFDCSIAETETVAQAQINLYQPADPAAYLKEKGL